METEKSLVRTSDVRLPKFVEDAYNTIEGMKQFAGMLLESKLVPDHFYEKGLDNKPDYTKGKVPAVVVVLLQAQQLAIPPMTALQHVIPVNGLLSIKGDLAKTMIFGSGKLRKDSWKETVTGTIEDENMVITITATREDNGLSLTRTFSVEKAKRMGLWITTAQVNSADGWKWKKSAWYKTPDRMIMYRCLGNLARDLFSDVLHNMYTTEEAQDIQKETAEVIETADGNKITIPDKDHAQKRSGKMTERVVDKIKTQEFTPVNQNVHIQDATVVNENVSPTPVPTPQTVTPQINAEGAAYKTVMTLPDNPPVPQRGSVEYMGGKEVNRTENTPKEGALTIPQMMDMSTDKLLEIVNADMETIEAMEMIPGKNTNKKLREIVFAHQQGTLDAHIEKEMTKIETPPVQTPPPAEVINQGGIPLNTMFDKQGPAPSTPTKGADVLQPDQPKAQAGNKYNIPVPEYDKGNQREFSTYKGLFNKLMGIEPQITTPRYMMLAEKLGILEKFKDKELFCRDASVAEINLLLNAN